MAGKGTAITVRAVTFGELMMRLTPPEYYRFRQAESFEVEYGGGEANVAVSLAVWGIHSDFVSKIPAHDIGEASIDYLRKYGVNTSHIIRGGDNLGLYFMERGISERGGKVIYDRKHSAFAEAAVSEYGWEEILNDADWFHVTGITPALSENTRNSCICALKEAKKRGITVSFDPNYRSTLWTKAEAAPVLKEMSGYTDVLITNMGQAEDIYGISGKSEEETAELLQQEFGCKRVALTERRTYSARKNDYSALLVTDGKAYSSRKHEVEVADRMGAGDAFAAGLIYAILNGYDEQRTIEFAVAAGSLKHTVEGDANLVSVEEIQMSADGISSGSVRR